MSVAEREREIERTRARLNSTIGRIQDKLTVSGVVDEVLGAANVPALESRYARALTTVRDNPIPVLLVAAGVGWALNRLGRRERALRAGAASSSQELPINDGRARRYDPDDPSGGRSDLVSLDGRGGARS